MGRTMALLSAGSPAEYSSPRAPATSIRGAHLDLAVANASLQAGGWVRGGPIQDRPVGQREPRAVPRADDASVLQVTLRQRAAEVRAGLGQRMHLAVLADQHDRYTVRLDAA